MNEPGARLYEIRVFRKVTEFVDGLTHTDRAKVTANIKIMEMGGFNSVYIKTLKGAVKELIVKSYRGPGKIAYAEEPAELLKKVVELIKEEEL